MRVRKVYKVHKVTGVLRTMFNGSESCRRQSAPQGSIEPYEPYKLYKPYKLKNTTMKQYTTITLLFLVGATFFSSCKLGKEYTRPELDLPEQIADTPATGTRTVADIQWPEIYTDTVLQGLIRTQLSYNKD